MSEWAWVGERAALAMFGGRLDDANEAALAFVRSVRGSNGVEDVIPGARSVLVVFDDPDAVWPSPPERMHPAPGDPTIHEIAVIYDGEDLGTLSGTIGLSSDELAGLHREPTYRVGFIGFAPGFPYLLGLPARLQAPRLATPRARVPAGSVAIGGAFTGVYPSAMPGGWHLIGRTTARLFDQEKDPPAMLQPGDRVRFVRA